MSGSWWPRFAARQVLRLYPSDFRRELGPAFVEAAEERWRRDYAAEPGSRSPGARLRFLVFLLRDAVRAAPEAWRTRPTPSTADRRARSGVTPPVRREREPVRWVESWAWDLRVAVRALVHRPATAVTVIGILALGIGANVAIFGVLDRVMLNPFPFHDGDRMTYVVDRNVETGWSISPTQEAVERWGRTPAPCRPWRCCGRAGAPWSWTMATSA